MTAEHPAELAARAARQHVVVIGAGIGGLVAARECAKVGMPVTVLETEVVPGGSIRSVDLDGVIVDAGADSFATRGGHVRALIDELGLGAGVIAPDDADVWLSGIPDASDAPLPEDNVLGIPANPFQEDVRAIIGWRGSWRAYLDRLRPPFTIGHERSLGKLVRSRMGARVHDRLVAPVTCGTYGVLPDEVDVDLAAPGLNAALTRRGSLAGAVMTLLAERAELAEGALLAERAELAEQTGPRAGAAVLGIEGGMGRLVDALLADLDGYGAEVRTATRVTGLGRGADGAWIVHAETPGDDQGDDAAEPLHATGILVATDGPFARTLLDPHVANLGAPQPAAEVQTVTLLLDAPELDTAPRGSSVLTVPGSHPAQNLVHATAKWKWLRGATQGRHVVRVSFGGPGSAATASLDDEAAAQLALAEASALLGVPLTADRLVAAQRERFTQAQPASLLGAGESAAGERSAAARGAIQAERGLGAVGAWLSGSGLAQVIPDAIAEADRLRASLLWD